MFKSPAGNVSFRLVIFFFSVQLLMNPRQCFKDGALADDFVLLPAMIVVFHHEFRSVLKKCFPGRVGKMDRCGLAHGKCLSPSICRL